MLWVCEASTGPGIPRKLSCAPGAWQSLSNNGVVCKLILRVCLMPCFCVASNIITDQLLQQSDTIQAVAAALTRNSPRECLSGGWLFVQR